jgi:hypothetical protein
MGTLIAFHVRAAESAVRRFVRKDETLLPAVGNDESTAFVAIELPLDDEQCQRPSARLAEISRALDTDVLWLSFQSTVDAFEYAHWKSSVLVRDLQYGCHKEERTWEEWSGTPERWEATARIHPGHFESLDAREVARTVARFWRLAGWDVEYEADSKDEKEAEEEDDDSVQESTTAVRVCPRCQRTVEEPNPARSTVAYARYWRGVCPNCESPLTGAS